MKQVTFFTKDDCTLCRAAWFVVKRVRSKIPFEAEIIDITTTGQEEWFALYKDHIPVVHLDGEEIFRHCVNERTLRELLGQ